ncbi:N-acetylmuramoyl-L-alanine amidase family protein [Parvularcula dongshanensis]|uniref:N-acetylmuramoyl-L-alanine amidase n=1 Tax=Parvularcula dongshanensis TaxID=1173995 RepID=A0A840I6G1_9PROT|nr:N-acetylmuramoyl-L-alanine amidase [Parvularcula dongshanensis]MBB4659851.1 N-acetylmuramoyl-L-alanine amidase [Parvularcula dongshanensis]
MGWAVRLLTYKPALVAAPLVAGLWALLAAAEEAMTTPTIEDVRLGVDAQGRTRVVLDMDARPHFTVTPQTGERIRIAVDGATYEDAKGEGLGIVASYAAEGGMLTLNLGGPALPVDSFVLPPAGGVDHYRLVIDLGGVSPETFAEASAAPAPTPRAADTPTELADLVPAPSIKPASEETPAAVAETDAPLRRTAKLVVIDPGHGGFDPGAAGPSGYAEEMATLEAAKTLRTILTARGYEVILTREDDSYVEHEQRIEMARRSGAELFLSLHADAHEDHSLRGASVYTLSEKRSARFAAEAKDAGNFSLYDVSLAEDERDVGAILFDLANEATQNESGRLAGALVSSLSGSVPMINNTHRKASLKVLLAADVPAVLVEMAFISNPEDEGNLRSPRWRRMAMGAVADGIDDYFGERMAAQAISAVSGG